MIEDEKLSVARSIAVADAKTKAKLADELGVDIVNHRLPEGNVSPISLNKEFRVAEEFALSDSSLIFNR